MIVEKIMTLVSFNFGVGSNDNMRIYGEMCSLCDVGDISTSEGPIYWSPVVRPGKA